MMEEKTAPEITIGDIKNLEPQSQKLCKEINAGINGRLCFTKCVYALYAIR